MKLFPFLICIYLTISLSAQSTVQEFFNAAKTAYQSGDHAKFYTMIIEAHKLHPYHPGILYQVGIAAALNDKNEEAINYLKQAVLSKADVDLSIKDLQSLERIEAFQQLKKLQTESQQPIIHSDTAFVIPDRTLHIESIAAGEKQNIFYLGSIHKRKIIRSDEKGNISNFTTEGQDGLTSVFSVKADSKRKVLWACASPMEEMENYDSMARSAVFKYDLASHKLLAVFYPESDKKNFVFGDLALHPIGNVFVSDSRNNVIFIVNETSRKLEPFFTSSEFWNLQGLTFSDDGQYLFVADYMKGIYRLDLHQKTLVHLPADFDLSVKSIDGLTFYNNSLIAIQNFIYPMRVTRYFLNATNDRIVNYKIIDRKHPAFNEPTIGCLVNDSFYYVANSMWSGYDEKHLLKPADQLQDVVILKTELKKVR